MNDTKPHIVGLAELRAKNRIHGVVDTEYELPNYDMFTNKDPQRGVALYFDKSLNARECTKINSHKFQESVWCTYKGGNDESVLVGCIYRSPNSNPENTQEMYKLLKSEELSGYDKICVFGDFNFPDARWDGNWSGEKNDDLVECFRDAFLIQKVTKPTRHREGQRSTLDDLVLVSEDNLISDIKYLNPVGKSDHNVLVFDLYVSRTKLNEPEKYSFNLSKGDYPRMREEMGKFDFSVLKDMDVDSTWNTIRDVVVEIMEVCIPKVKSINGARVKPRWMTQTVAKSVKKKHSLYKRFLCTKRGRDYEKYKVTRNKCSKLIKRARKDYEKNIADGCKKSPKLFWKYVQERAKSNAGISALKTGNGFAVSDDEKAETLNKFFSSVFTLEDTSNIPDLTECQFSNGVSVSEILVTPEAVEVRLRSLDASKAQGPDNIPPKVLKELAKELAAPLSVLFNKSLETASVPNDWKKANVTAIFKKGNKSEPGNYRPVSLTCIACKVMESVVRDVIVSHFKDNNLFAKCQHGFRCKRSCMTQLLEVMEELTLLLDGRNAVDILYLDFRKAFDSVPHERLLLKMKAYGITGNILHWTRSFLTNRIQKVKVGSAWSSEGKVLSGIPQGSILGPVLFTIFINDLPDCVQSSCKIFADDTKIYGKTDNSQCLQDDIDRMQRWTEVWNLYFNAEKCKVLHLGKNNPCNNYTMTLNGTTTNIMTCNEEKDLGVTFDKALTFDPHIQNSINKANKMVGLIKRTFTFLDRDTFNKLYKALVRPHLEYGNIIWYPYLKRQSVAVEKVQRRATKLLKECRNMTYSERLIYLDLHSLKGRRLRGDLIETYKIYHGLVDLQWNDFFSETPRSNTRNAEGKIFIKHCNTNLRKFCFSNRVANHWNNLCSAIKNAQNSNTFKNLLDASTKFLLLFRSFDE